MEEEVKNDQANSDPTKATSVHSVPIAGTAATKLCQLVLDGDLDPKEIRPARSHLATSAEHFDVV